MPFVVPLLNNEITDAIVGVNDGDYLSTLTWSSHTASGITSVDQIINWSLDNAKNIHTNNYTDTTYVAYAGTTIGLVPVGLNGSTKYLREDGTWVVPPDNNTTYVAYTGTAVGLVPVGLNGSTKYLREDGTWVVPPDNDTTYVAYAGTTSGLVPTGLNGSTKYLREDGTWIVPPDTTYIAYAGTTIGLVPVGTNGVVRYLREDGTWVTPPDTTYIAYTGTTIGLVPAGTNGIANYLREDGTWATPDYYIHPTTDGSLHVTAVDAGGADDGKVLTAGATAGAFTWTTAASGTTNLTIGTTTSTTVDINSSSGTNATIPASTGSIAGLMSSTQYNALASAVQPDTVNVYSSAQKGAVGTVSYGTSVALDMNSKNNFSITLTGALTLANPTNITADQMQGGIIALTQDANGGRVLTLGSNWVLVGTDDAVTTPNTINVYQYTVINTTNVLIQFIKAI